MCSSLLYSISAVSDMHDYGLDMPVEMLMMKCIMFMVHCFEIWMY